MNKRVQFQLSQFDEDGYFVVRLKGSNELIDEINCDVYQLIDSGNNKTNSKIYSNSNAPHPFDDTQVLYNPSFSDPIKEKYVFRVIKFTPSA